MTVAIKKKPHPVSKINKYPRLLAAYSYLIFVWSDIGNDILLPPAVVVLVLGSTWPFLSFWLACKKGTKKQEMINMHVDTLLSASICLILPSPMVIFSVLVVLLSNALFIGFFKLFLSVVLIFISLTLPCIYFFDIQLIEISNITKVLILSFLTLYFGFNASNGFDLIEKYLRINEKVRELSIKDPLTGCYNRLYLDKELTREINRCVRMTYPMALIFADIDHFKKINDTLGHSGGDEVLRIVSRIFNESIRNEFDWVVRYGGEEFVIVLANVSIDEGVELAEKIRNHIENREFLINGEKIRVTSSFGVTAIDDFSQPPSADNLITQADKGLYRAKNSGRNRVEKILISES